MELCPVLIVILEVVFGFNLESVSYRQDTSVVNELLCDDNGSPLHFKFTQNVITRLLLINNAVNTGFFCWDAPLGDRRLLSILDALQSYFCYCMFLIHLK